MILLTGASGFIGKHLLIRLQEKFGKKNIVVFTSRPIKGVCSVIHNNYQFHPDVFIDKGLEEIETIIHAGSFIPKNRNLINDLKLCNSNIYNTEKLLSSNLPNLKKVIYLSSVDVYGQEAVINEMTIERPVSMYGYSKLYSEKMIEIWGEENNKIIQIFRIGHVYGPGEEGYQKLIPETFKNILNKKNLIVWGRGDELRSFIYVNDVVKAIINSIKFGTSLGLINIVGKNAISINEIVDRIKNVSKSDQLIINKDIKVSGRDLVFDNTKLRHFLLKNETSFEDGLLEEFDYMKNLYKQE